MFAGHFGVAAGVFYYFRYVLQNASPKSKGKKMAAGFAMTAFLLLSFGTNFI